MRKLNPRDWMEDFEVEDSSTTAYLGNGGAAAGPVAPLDVGATAAYFAEAGPPAAVGGTPVVPVGGWVAEARISGVAE